MKWTSDKIRALKGRGKIASVTAYDYAMARLVDETGVQLVLVGDSLAEALLGYESTLPVTMREMLHHTAAVARGVQNALVVADMPFMSYQISAEQALFNAGRFLKQAGAGGVKIEGGVTRAALVARLTENSIPVLGHIGLLPQSVLAMGGYKIQGRGADAVGKLVADAQALERAGAFAIVVEGVPPSAGRAVTAAVGIPTIGCGAGPDCDGQILVLHDLLGLGPRKAPRFAKAYANLADEIKGAVARYRTEVEAGTFPGPDNCYPE